MATNSYCQQWLRDKTHNPYTGRKITKNGKQYQKLLKECVALSPRSGQEPVYDPIKWNKPFRVSAFNCYDYAFNNHWAAQNNRNQPGMLSGKYKTEPEQIHQCDYMSKMIKTDHPKIQKSSFEKTCPNNYYKIAMLVDPVGDSTDYHFLRQDSNGFWSHKLGDLPIDNVDADGNLIFAPHLANFQYPKYKYKDYCGYFCVPEDSFEQFRSPAAITKLEPIKKAAPKKKNKVVKKNPKKNKK